MVAGKALLVQLLLALQEVLLFTLQAGELAVLHVDLLPRDFLIAVLHGIEPLAALAELVFILALQGVDLSPGGLLLLAFLLVLHPLGDDEKLVLALGELDLLELHFDGIEQVIHVDAVARLAPLTLETRRRKTGAAPRRCRRHRREQSLSVEHRAHDLPGQWVVAALAGARLLGRVAEQARVRCLEVLDGDDHGKMLLELLVIKLIEVGASRLLALFIGDIETAMERVIEVPPDVIAIHAHPEHLFVPLIKSLIPVRYESNGDLIICFTLQLQRVRFAPMFVEFGGNDLEIVRAVLVLNHREGRRKWAGRPPAHLLFHQASENVFLKVIGVRLRTGKLHGEVLLAG